MSSDADLRMRVRGLLQNVIDDRHYQQGSLMYPFQGNGTHVGGSYVGGDHKSDFNKSLQAKQCYLDYLKTLPKPSDKKPIKLTEIEQLELEIKNEITKQKIQEEKKSHFDAFYKNAKAKIPGITRKEAAMIYEKANKAYNEKKMSELIDDLNKKKEVKPEGKGGKKKCKKGYRKKKVCVKRGKGNIYDYLYGDGMDSESDDEYEGDGVLVGGKKRKRRVCKNKKGKKLSPWVCHVKAFARKHKLTYAEALQHRDIKKGYRKVKGKGLSEMFYN